MQQEGRPRCLEGVFARVPRGSRCLPCTPELEKLHSSSQDAGRCVLCGGGGMRLTPPHIAGGQPVWALPQGAWLLPTQCLGPSAPVSRNGGRSEGARLPPTGETEAVRRIQELAPQACHSPAGRSCTSLCTVLAFISSPVKWADIHQKPPLGGPSRA